MTDEEKLNVACHVYVQWVAGRGELAWWVDEMEKEHERHGKIDPDDRRLINYYAPYDFTNWNFSASDSIFEKLHQAWKPVRKELVASLNKQ